MSNEQAVKWLKAYLQDTPFQMEQYEQAFDMAIKALSQEPCDDAVSRDAVEEITWEEPSYTDALNVLTEVRDKVRALPSVTQKSKTGHWKRISMDKYTTHAQYWYECDKCGEHNLGNTDYCPSCGARMESEDKE